MANTVITNTIEDPTRKNALEKLTNTLQSFYEYKVQSSLHRKAECEDLVYNVVHKIIRKVQTVDSRFRANSLVSLGMPYDGIHGDEPTDFEMMLQLSLGRNNSLFLHRHKSGLSTRIQPKSSSLWNDCIEENSVYVSPKMITIILRELVKRAVYVLRKYIDGKRTDKLPDHLTSLELEEDRNRIFLRINKTIRVRVLPSVSVPDCRSDMSRKDIPSSSHVVACCQRLSSTHDNNKENFIDDNNNNNLISQKNSQPKLVWRFSFFVAEKNKMRTISDGCRIKLLRILTEIRDSEPQLAKLSSYHLQTMFFHETDRLHRRREWKDTKISMRFLDLLRAVSTHLHNSMCINYFMHQPDYPTVNLFEDINRKDLQLMKEVIDKILENPLEVLKHDIVELEEDDEEDEEE